MNSGDRHHELITAEDGAEKYSQTMIEHATNPRNVGSLPNPDGFTRFSGPCGDTVELWLRVQDDTITKATFWTDGCGPAIACASVVTEMIKGKKVSEAQRIQQEDILKALGGLPDDHKHCALLAATTLKRALEDHLVMRRESWKKAYRER